MNMKPKASLKIKFNSHIEYLLNRGCDFTKQSDHEYIRDLIMDGFKVIEERLEHEGSQQVFAHFQDAMNHFNYDDTVISVEFDRAVVQSIRLFCKEYMKDSLDVSTMLLCYSLLRH